MRQKFTSAAVVGVIVNCIWFVILFFSSHCRKGTKIDFRCKNKNGSLNVS